MPSLIEILISIVLISILLLGTDALQITSLQTARANYYATYARQQLTNLNEYLIANNGRSTDYLPKWNEQNTESLPEGHGFQQGSQLYIFWGEKNANSCPENKIGKSGCLHSEVTT